MKSFNRKYIFFAAIFFSLLFINVYPQSSVEKIETIPNSEITNQYHNYAKEIKPVGKVDIAFPSGDNAVSIKFSENYFKIDKSNNTLWNGKHWIFSDFPLAIYVENSSSKYYKSKYKFYVDYALQIWEAADERIKFILVNKSSNANIVITFEEDLMGKYGENYLGFTNYTIGENKNIEKANVEISMLKFNDQIISDGEIKATIIHELGHALGLGHSENKIDLMYPFIDPLSSIEMTYNELSIGDIEAIRSVVNLGDKIRYSIK